MGKATILEHLGEGLYRVRMAFDTLLLQQRIARLVARRQQLLAAQSAAVVAELQAKSAADVARGTLDALIDGFASGGVESAEVVKATAAAMEASVAYQAARVTRVGLDASLLSVGLDVDELERVRAEPEPELLAWCADYSLELEGEVGTVEVTAEPVGQDPAGLMPVIHPGWLGAGAWRCERDGVYQVQRANELFHGLNNALLLAAWQTHRPRHRLAQIVAIDREADSCSLVIDGAVSSVQGLAVDPPDAALLTQVDVPILYMDCNSAVFGDGDRVLVAFAGDWTTPTVIGFESEPRPCALAGMLLLPAADGAGLNGWGEPVDQANAPLGTPGGQGLDPFNHRYTLRPPGGEYLRRGMAAYDAVYPVARFSPRPVAGNCDWFGEALAGDPLTWDKGVHRYFDGRTEWQDPVADQSLRNYLLGQRVDKSISPTGEHVLVTSVYEDGGDIKLGNSGLLDGSALYFRGHNLAEVGLHVGGRVAGAGAAEHSYQQGGELVTDTWLLWVVVSGLNGSAQDVLQERVFAQRLLLDAAGDVVGVVGVPALLGELDYLPNANGNLCASGNQACWAFSQSGRAAAALRSRCDEGGNDGVLELYQLAFVIDETGVLMGAPAIESAGSGLETWSTVNGAHFLHSIDAELSVIAAVDYRDNQLQRALVTQTVTSRVDVEIVPLVNTDNVNAGTVVETHTITLSYAGKDLVLSSGTVTTTSTFVPPAGEWPTPASYITTLDRVTDITSRALLWLDLRHAGGYVAYSEVHDTGGRSESYQGTQIDDGPNYNWSATEVDTIALAYREEFGGVGQVWSDAFGLETQINKAGSGDIISDGKVVPGQAKTITGIELEGFLAFYPGDGSRAYLKTPYETNGQRPSPVVIGNNGALVAISSASGFNSAPWMISKRHAWYNYPAGMLSDAGLEGQEDARVCPVVRV